MATFLWFITTEIGKAAYKPSNNSQRAFFVILIIRSPKCFSSSPSFWFLGDWWWGDPLSSSGMFLRYLWQREKNLSACFFRYDESLLFAPSWDSLLVPSRVSKSISRAKLSSFTQRFLNQLQSPTAPLLKEFFCFTTTTSGSRRTFFCPVPSFFFRFFFTLGKSFHDNYTTLALSFGIWPSVKSNKKMNINWWETGK